MDTHPSYINPDGRYVEYEDLASHIGIVVRIDTCQRYSGGRSIN